MFSRTPAGKVAKFLFYPEVVVWVEGQTDVVFYERLLRGRPVRFEVAGGSLEVDQLADAIREYNHPYVVIRDGDYHVLFQSRSSHRRVIILDRYSVENYLVEAAIINRVCQSYCQEQNERVADQEIELFRAMVAQLVPLVALDVAHSLANTGQQILPDNIHALLLHQNALALSQPLVERILDQAIPNVPNILLSVANEAINRYVATRSMDCIVKGHLVFGAIRHIVICAVERARRRRPTVDNNALLALLVAEVWHPVHSADHRNLARRVRAAVRDAKTLRDAYVTGV